MTLQVQVQDPFSPALYGGTRFPHDHPVKGLGSGFAKINWSSPQQRVSHHLGCLTCSGRKIAAPLGPFMLPLPPARPALAMEVRTLRWGNADWMQECAPTLDDWCQRHGYPLKVTATWDKSYPDPKFCEVDMLRDFLAGESEWMLYVDADIVVHPSAPPLFFAQPGFYIREDTHGRENKRWFEWCQEKFGATPDPHYLYRNAGVWACDREAARQMLEVISEPYHEGIMEQDQWNWWISHAEKTGMNLQTLPHEWNRFPREHRPSWFFHIYSKAKMRHLLKFRQLGLLPDYVQRLKNPPAIPDFGKGAVVWPYKAEAAKWDELWFSHRSVIQHWREKDWPLILLAETKPPWWPGEFVHAPSYEAALWIGTQCAQQVLWMNDDIFMLADQGLEEFEKAAVLNDTRAELGNNIVAANIWRKGFGQVTMRCHHHGKSTLDFSTHTPYLFERQKAAEVHRVFGQFYKMPFETAYHNWHGTKHFPAATQKSNGPHDLESKLWINPAFSQVTPGFREEMARRLGEPEAAEK